jgi:hypothetical protein
MVATTRQQKKDILNRVLKDIVQLPNNSNLHKECEHDETNDMDTLLLFSPMEIEDMKFMVDTTRTALSNGDKGIVYSLLALEAKRKADGNPILHDWSNVTAQQYDDFRVSPDYKSSQTGLPNPNATISNVPVAPSFVRSRDPVADFMKGVRRDPKLFVPLKQDKQWDSWNLSTTAQARSQGLSDIFDPNFVPVTPEAIELFGEKQKFVFAVFDKKLLTDKGKLLVRHYAKTSDAQKVFCNLSLYASSSTMANMEAEDLLKYITSIRFGDGMWKGTAHDFILN